MPKDSEQTRYESLIDMGEDTRYLLPKIKYFKYLLSWLDQIGYFNISSMGNSPLSFQDIYSFGKILDITFFEANVLRRLSKIYVCKQSQYKAKNMPRPYFYQARNNEHNKNPNRLREALSNLKKG